MHLPRTILLLTTLATTTLSQNTQTSAAGTTQTGSAAASATIFVPLEVPPLLSPYISRVSASLIAADACAATYALSISQPIALSATVTQGPSTYSASIYFGGPNVASCNPFNSQSVSCTLSGDFVMNSARASASFTGSALSRQFYTVPLTGGVGLLSRTSGTCSTVATGGSSSVTMSGGSSSGVGGGSQMTTASGSSTRSGNGAAPVAVIKVIYKVAVVPAVVAAML